MRPAGSSAGLIGKIVLARFLERPLPLVVAAVEAAERSARRTGLLGVRNAPLRPKRLRLARLDSDGAPCDTLGCIKFRAGRPVLLLHSAVFAHEYVLDGARLSGHLAQLSDDDRATALRALRTLLLVTTRNRITLEVCSIVLDAQRTFLRTLDESLMVPLTGRAIAREARRRGTGAAEPSRVSRLLRSTLVVLPDGNVRSLRSLCPTSRQVLRAHVRKILDLERRLRAQGHLLRAWSDSEIARRVSQQVGFPVSRRLVSYCRHALGAPGLRRRQHQGCYLSATAGFSTLLPLDRKTVLRRAPMAGGLYELRLARDQRWHQFDNEGIIYIGRAKNLRYRLVAHATGKSRNPVLAHYIQHSKVLFRFRLENGNLREAEARIYRQFREAYGRPPECNRLHP